MAIAGGVALRLPFAVGFRILGAVLVLLHMVALYPTLLKYGDMAGSICRREPLFSDTGYKIVNYLNERDVSGRYVYLTMYHVGYCLTGAEAPTRYAHPSDIAKRFLLRAMDGETATPERELDAILGKEPVFIVKPERLWYFDQFDTWCNALLDSEIRENYTLEAQFGDIYIYGKKNLRPESGGAP
jgi:hypothetical protein